MALPQNIFLPFATKVKMFSFILDGDRMSIRIADLHEAYASASQEDRVAMANLGAVCWGAVKSELFSHWETAMSADESVKADTWRKEGAAAMLESVKTRLAMADTLSMRLATAEATVSQLKADMEAEAAKRAEALVAAARQDFLAAKAMEFADMKADLAAAEAKGEMMDMVKKNQSALDFKIQTLEAELDKYRAASATKSSHALGKIGEKELFEMLNKYVLPSFPYAKLRDMTSIGHVADFHLWVSGPTNKRTKILLDSKKYTTPVQTGEIEKLYKDVDGDDEADAGLMVSLDSAIYTKLQFQIAKTKKGKPCMFISFEKLDDGIRQEVLCWAVRVLIEVVALDGKDEQDIMIEDLRLFLAEMDASVSDLDSCLKTCKTLHDTISDSKGRMMMRINTYRVRCGISVSSHGEVITHAASSSTRCSAKNGSGEQCKSRSVAKKDLCARHVAMVAEGKMVVRA
jgi:prefoldin subunit 5